MTAGGFDPYYKWLGIPPEEQPPTFYRLLGIVQFEADTDVIANAANRQMVHLRQLQQGQYAAVAQQILKEVAAAKATLLNPEAKTQYDQSLIPAEEEQAEPGGRRSCRFRSADRGACCPTEGSSQGEAERIPSRSAPDSRGAFFDDRHRTAVFAVDRRQTLRSSARAGGHPCPAIRCWRQFPARAARAGWRQHRAGGSVAGCRTRARSDRNRTG